MDLGISGRIAVVSHASKGIGRGIALELASNGASVVMTARGKEALDEAVQEAVAAGGKAIGVQADMGEKADVQRVVAEARKAFGHPDIIVTSAVKVHMPMGMGFDNTTDDEFRLAHDDFIMSLVYLVREVLPHMKEQRWGRIIGITSSCVKMPHFENNLPLANLRVGTIGLLKTLSNEYGEYGITANSIAPGPILTPALVGQLGSDPEPFNQWTAANVPMKRAGDPRDVGAAVAFLASERANFVTGQTLNVDGGYSRNLY
jgi:3-oxoacyl-[acyl-carrier protein] reductase